MIAQVLARKAPTVATARVLQQRDRPAAHRAAGRRATTRYLVLEMGARGIGHIAELCLIARPDDLARPQRRHRPHRRVRRPQAKIAEAKGEIVEALPADGGAPSSTPTTRSWRHGRPAPRPGWCSSERPRRGRTAENVAARRPGPPAFTLTHAGARDVTMRLYGEHHVSNALAAAAVAHELGIPLDEIAGALRAGTLSRWRMEVTERPDGVTRRQRRLQREPRVHASRAACARPDRGARGGARWRCSARWPSSGASARRARRGRALAVRLNVSKLVAVGGRERPAPLGAYNEGSWGEESVHVSERAGGGRPVARAKCAGRRRAGEGVQVGGLERVAHGCCSRPTTRARSPADEADPLRGGHRALHPGRHPLLIKLLARKGYGQFIRDDGPRATTARGHAHHGRHSSSSWPR